jgi:hypothetical protein
MNRRKTDRHDRETCILADLLGLFVKFGFGFIIPGKPGTYVLDQFRDWVHSPEGYKYMSEVKRKNEKEKVEAASRTGS